MLLAVVRSAWGVVWAGGWLGQVMAWGSSGLLKCPARLAESRLVRPAQALWVPGCQLRSGGRCAVDQSEGL